ncbi:unnamed protein product [Toxocara canis]|uniref:ABC2_membrane domain-containing protein n=1 Tax=Toxocara canis TaxID=6265 RepID=A0A183TZ19_TOXCA|nr:unnamed protein product [Toxocara canis]
MYSVDNAPVVLSVHSGVRFIGASGETTLSDADHAQKPGTIDSPSQYAAVKSDSCFKDSPSKPSLMSWSDEVAPMVLPNKAQLPSGIENIRPHLQNVDNVPLLVNLFSDSDHHTSREMIEIMQVSRFANSFINASVFPLGLRDNGEVVLVVGSSLNYHNGRIFSKGNCSICVEPQRPAVCCYELNKAVTSNLQATHLASRLMGICTNIILPSDVSLDLIALISECRYRLRLSRSAMSFFLQSSFSLYLLQFFSLFPFAPSMLTAFQMFLLACVYVPVVTFAITALGGQGNDCIDQISQKNTGDVAWKAMRRMSISVLVVYLPNVSFVAVVYVALVMTGTTTLKTSSTNSIISWSPDDVVHTARHVAAFLVHF